MPRPLPHIRQGLLHPPLGQAVQRRGGLQVIGHTASGWHGLDSEQRSMQPVRRRSPCPQPCHESCDLPHDRQHKAAGRPGSAWLLSSTWTGNFAFGAVRRTSSRTSNGAALSTALATATRCFSPPLSRSPRSLRLDHAAHS